MKILVMALLFFAGCSKEGIEKMQTNNSEIEVTLLFEHDGCRVYRFFDDGRKYFTNCNSAFWEERYQCGKTTCKRSAENLSNQRQK